MAPPSTRRKRPLSPTVDFETEQGVTEPAVINLDAHRPDPTTYDEESGASVTEHADGSATVSLNGGSKPSGKKPYTGNEKFYTNLAPHMEESELAGIASRLLEGIRADLVSRKEWLDTRARGVTLLGTKLDEPRADTGTAPTQLEGVSTVRHPLLCEAAVAFQAGARGEILPSQGPLKIRNDSTPPPSTPLSPMAAMAPQAAQAPPQAMTEQAPLGAPQQQPGQAPPMSPAQQVAQNSDLDEEAQALEKQLNHYLTVTAVEYIPDTDRMLFTIPFGGDGFKKVYPCPLRRRPVSESVDPEDLIVSNSAVALEDCGRVTHRVKMRPSVLRRMQLLGAYLDIELNMPVPEPLEAPQRAEQEAQGFKTDRLRPEDADYTLYECYCELDLDDFAPPQFKGKKLPLPYAVTIEKDSQKILAVKRNWEEHDEQCMRDQVFVQFPFLRAIGFYGWGFVHLVGNTTIALTAAWRLMLDNGMYANFPGWVHTEIMGKQNSNMHRVPPGGGIPFKVPHGDKLSDHVMPIPIKEVGPAFPALVEKIEDTGRKLAMTSNIQVGEGKQDAPVGTTLALIEQATKIVSSAFKRIHESQIKEFGLLRKCFQRDPEALWRFDSKPKHPWTKSMVLKALSAYELVPVADPDNPTSLHRMAKGALIKALQAANPAIYDAVAVDKRVLTIAGVDPNGLFNEHPQPAQPPDPKLAVAQLKAQTDQKKMELEAQLKREELDFKKQQSIMEANGQAREAAGREKLENMKAALEHSREQTELKIAHLTAVHDTIDNLLKIGSDHHMAQQQHQAEQNQFAAETQMRQQEHAHKMEQEDRHFMVDQSRQAQSDERSAQVTEAGHDAKKGASPSSK